MEPSNYDAFRSMLQESLQRPDLDVTYDLSLDLMVAPHMSNSRTQLCKRITAQPTCGKTTFVKKLREQGKDALDTDEPIGYVEPSIFKLKKVNKDAEQKFQRWETAIQQLAFKWGIPMLSNFIPDEVLNQLGPSEIYFMHTNPRYIYQNECRRHSQPRFTEQEVVNWIEGAVNNMGWGKYTVVLPHGTVIGDYIYLGSERDFAYHYVESGGNRWILRISENPNAFHRVMWKGKTKELKQALKLLPKQDPAQLRKRWAEVGVKL